MPFVAACSFCPYKLTVPDQAMGAPLRCPQCGNYFTVAPSETAPVSKPRRPPPQPPPAPPPAPTPPPPPAADQPWWVTTPANPVAETTSAETATAPAASEPTLPKEAPLPAPAVVAPEPPEPSSLPPWINVWGVLAFALAALALLLAAFALPRWLSLSFTGLGGLLAVAGLAARREEWKLKDGVWLTLGGGGCALVLLLGLARPDWFNNRWGRDFEVREPERNKPIQVNKETYREVKELDNSDRVDAAMHAVRYGDVVVRIDSAVVERLTPKDAPVLLIALHLKNAGPVQTVTYHGQGGEQHRAIVRDSRGQELKRRDLGAEAKKRGQVGEVSILPLHEVNDLIAVEAPFAGTGHVEVDVPAAAWGREGACKFTVSTFVRKK
jgi:hypothetical protein